MPETNKPPIDALLRLLRQVSRTREDEISCDDCFDLLDAFAELVHNGENAAGLMPLVQQHLDLCRDCREEFEALIEVLAANSQ